MTTPVSELPPDSLLREEEVDIWWGAYAGRTLLPRWIILAILSILILLATWYLQEPQIPDLIRGVELLLVFFWLLQLGLWLYRVFAIHYRLTSRRLFYQRGYSPTGSAVVPLSQVTRVLVDRGPLERFAKVGRIYVYLDSPGEPYLVLKGVVEPEQVAHQIRKHAQRLQAKEMTSS